MMKSLLIIIVICGLISTSHSQERTPRFRIQNFEKFIELDSTNLILIPIEWGNNGKVDELKIQGKGSNKNIFFYDPSTEYEHFLFDSEEQIISSYSGHLLRHRLKNDSSKRPPNKLHIYYEIIKDDYNQDSRLDFDDPKYLYLSNFDGSELTLLTPRYYHLRFFKYIENGNIILATLIED